MTILRKSARGRECQIRIPGVCNFDQQTTIPAHLNGGGMALKQDDLFLAFSCSACHDVVDGRVKTEFSPMEIRLWHYEGVHRTQQLWLDEGLLTIQGEG